MTSQPKRAAPAKAPSISRLTAALRAAYPQAHCALDHRNALELLVATILSAQCTDKRVNLVTPALFARFRTAVDFANASPRELERMIRSTGFFRNKAKAIRAACKDIVEKHGGQVPDTMEALTNLHGVGRKTANVVLGNAFAKNEGVVVDTHVGRLARRLGLTRQINPEKIERDLMRLVPRELWAMFAHWLIWHGRQRCFARNPDCEHCELARWCPKIGVEK
jgi:endonuclease-3